ncbi:hypothetical protein HWD94_06795 [Pseudarthrobacter equi]|uniref:hypothetical protein n=1 Tax=Pseudarthrobacter equi TaxID=728066 RepID=UPI0021BEB337|nr:hypothetical protein [Pseudarthrobacter equi]MCT9624828.1 hypothetical protein [Pseudarthrobacter equi]
MNLSEPVKIELSEDQALVLFDWLCRLNDGSAANVADHAEQRVLWDIQSGLESVLAAPLQANYNFLLAQARNRVKDATQ